MCRPDGRKKEKDEKEDKKEEENKEEDDKHGGGMTLASLRRVSLSFSNFFAHLFPISVSPLSLLSCKPDDFIEEEDEREKEKQQGEGEM